MAKYRYAMDEQKIARFIKEGRGKGEGQDYKPWLKIQDVPSIGRSSRPYSHKTGREHHFLSDIENAAFFFYHWSDDVVDIREQYPIDRAVTQQIAKDMGVPHPADPQTGCQIVMTTDLLINTLDMRLLARSVKPHDSFDRRVLDKLEIERRYWELQSVDWGLITQHELPENRINNIRWAHELHSLDSLVVPYSGYWEDRCKALINFLHQAGDITIRMMIDDLENSHHFGPGEAITVIRHLISNKKIHIDMDKRWDVKSHISFIGLLEDPTSEERIRVA